MIVSPEYDGARIDVFLSAETGHTRSHIQRAMSDGCVRLNGKVVSKSCKVKVGDEVEAEFPKPKELQIAPEDIPLDVRYEDDDLLVVNKPRGMVVHPAPGNYDATLVNALLKHCGDSLSGINGVIRPGIVHRIDKDTSGLLIVAKNDFSHNGLAMQIKEHSFTREYSAVVHGRFKTPMGMVDAPIGRSEKDRKKMCVTEKNSKNAVTYYEVLKELSGFSLVRLRLETGRTHQIRVHMAYIGHPVAGDMVYGPKNGASELGGQCLHAGKIGFVHPRTGEYVQVESELPEYFTGFVKKHMPKK